MSRGLIRIGRCLPLLLLCCALWPGTAGAHTFHVSLAEAEWNPSSGRLEVSLRTLPDDLERALSDALHRKIVLEKEPDLDTLIAQHLEQVFIVHDAIGEEKAHHWVGKDLRPQEVWLYFEVELPDGLEGVEIEYLLLLRQEPHQVNTLNLKQGEWRGSLTFLRGEERQRVVWR